jgi:hypothetical protein
MGRLASGACADARMPNVAIDKICLVEEIGSRRNELVRVSPHPRYPALVTLVMIEDLSTGGGYRGRGERTQADVSDYLRRFVVGADDYLDYWLTHERSG